jgi:hypothetical protein
MSEKCKVCNLSIDETNEDQACFLGFRNDTEDKDDTEDFLRTVEILIKPSATKRHVIGGDKKTALGWRKFIVEETKWPGTVTCCHKSFSLAGALRYHVEQKHVRHRRYQLG